jgi:dipeptidyl aminopeptidase/acylaminoacyl peptidase
MKLRTFIILALIIVSVASSEAQNRFDFDTMMSLKRITDPRVSPDGNRIVFTMGTTDMEANRVVNHIYSMQSDGGDLKQLTSGPRSASSARWSPDGRLLAFTTGGQLWLMNSDGTDQRQLSKISTGVSGPEWTPDGKSIGFLSEVYPECATDDCNRAEDERVEKSGVKAKETERLLYRHWDEWRERKRTHLFLISIGDQSVRQITSGDFDSPPYSAGSGVDFAFSPDGKEILFLRNPDAVEAISTNSDIFAVSIEGGEARNLTKDNKGYDVSPIYTPDGKFIIYRSQSTPRFEADRWRIIRLDRKTGERLELTSGFDFQVDQMTLSSDGKRIFFVAGVKGRSPIFSVDVVPPNITLDGRQIKKVADGYFGSISANTDGSRLIGLKTSMSSPSEIFAINTTDGKSTNLSNANIALPLESPEELDWIGGANTRVHGFVVKPNDFDPNKKYPLIVLIHGGPQGAWSDTWSYRWNAQIYANAGYVVFMPNPRGSTGYGQKFVNEISGDWGGLVYTDIMNGVAEVIKAPYVDRNRIGAAGASYGGYMVNWLLGHNNDPRFKFKAFVSHAGVFNLESMALATEELFFVEWEFGGMPWENKESYSKWSPHRFADRFETPTLVIHGELDYRVPVGEGLQLYTALQRRGVPSRLLYFPDEGHWILKPRNSELWHRNVLEWFARHLR